VLRGRARHDRHCSAPNTTYVEYFYRYKVPAIDTRGAAVPGCTESILLQTIPKLQLFMKSHT
jgi:hypothetical protein